MKKTILAILLIPILSTAQTKIHYDTLFLDNGVRFVKGQDVLLGIGSNTATRGFNYIYTSPGSIAGMVKLTSVATGLKMHIKDVMEIKSKKLGHKYFLKLGAGTIVNYYCEVEMAVQSKEVIVPGFNDKDTQQDNTLSKADELKKWKDLFDSGTITKEQYEAQKNKILQ